MNYNYFASYVATSRSRVAINIFEHCPALIYVYILLTHDHEYICICIVIAICIIQIVTHDVLFAGTLGSSLIVRI